MTATYRQANEKDIDGLIDVMKDTGYAAYVYPGQSTEGIKKEILSAMKKKTYLVCVEKRIVGYFIIGPLDGNLTDIPKSIILKKGYAYHAGVGVHSSERGKGVASALTTYAFRMAKELGYTGIYADVCSTNEASVKLQERCGFREVTRYPSATRPEGTLNVVYEKQF